MDQERKLVQLLGGSTGPSDLAVGYEAPLLLWKDLVPPSQDKHSSRNVSSSWILQRQAEEAEPCSAQPSPACTTQWEAVGE